jgi:hypothetical protein
LGRVRPGSTGRIDCVYFGVNTGRDIARYSSPVCIGVCKSSRGAELVDSGHSLRDGRDPRRRIFGRIRVVVRG